LRRRAHDLEYGPSRTARRLSDERVPTRTRVCRSHRGPQESAHGSDADYRLLRPMIARIRLAAFGRMTWSSIVGVFDSLKKLFAGGGGPKRKKALPKTDISKRFDLRGRTGQGSMSKVYQAYDNKIGRSIC